MKSASLAFRKAIFSAIDNITYSGANIRTFEEWLQETNDKRKAVLIEGNKGVEAYIILLNQTTNNTNAAKCARTDESNIQIQVTTVWPANRGGSLVSEEISELVINRLFTPDGLFKNIDMPEPFSLWKMDFEGTRNINYDTTSTRVWITQILVSGLINQ